MNTARRLSILGVAVALAGLALLSVGSGSAAAPAPTLVVTIGFAGALTGGAAPIGWPEANAAQLAVDQVNAAGGLDIGGALYQVALVLADDQCSAAQAPLAAQALLNAGAVGVVGHTCSSATIPAEPVYAAARVASISPSSTGAGVTQQGYDTTFRTVSRDGSQYAQLARYFRRGLGLERTSIVAFAGATPPASGYYSTTFAHLAGTITGVHQVADTAEFTSTLTAVKHNEQPDALLYADWDPTRAGLFSRAAYAVGMEDVTVGWSTSGEAEWALVDYQAAAGDAAARDDVVALQFRRLEDMPGWPKFLADYQAEGFPNYGLDPGMYGAYAYDAAKILMAAIDRADSLNPAAIRDQVAAMHDHVGVVGTYRGFDAVGDVVPQWGWLEQNRHGQWVDLEFYTWDDGFDGPDLEPLWYWVRENPAHWSLSARPGWLRIVTQPGTLHGAGINQENLLLLPAPPGNLYITTWLDFAPTESIQQAGLLLYQDDENYVQLSRAYVYGDNYVQMVVEVDGQGEVEGVPETATGLYLQLQRRGDEVEGYYSLDGIQWTRVWQATAPLAHIQVGLGAAGPAGLPADFDDFELVGGLPARDYGWADPFDQALDPRWSWVREDPAYWSLTAQPGYLQITTQPAPGGLPYNLLLQAAPSMDYQVDTRLLFAPQQDFQIAGLLFYQDDSNHLLLGRAFCSRPDVGVGNGIYFDRIEGGTSVGSNFATAVALPYLAHLQVARSGDEYWGFYGEDGIYWTLVGRHQVGPALHPARIGLKASNQVSQGGGQVLAAFDWFRVEADYWNAHLPLVLRNR